MTDPADLFDRLPRPITEAITEGRLAGAALQVWLACWRQERGRGRATTETWCSTEALVAATRLHSRTVRDAMAQLRLMGAVVVADPAHGPKPPAYSLPLDPWLTPGAGTQGTRARGADTLGRSTPGTPGAGTQGTPGLRTPPYENRDENKDEGERRTHEAEQERARPRSLGGTAPEPVGWSGGGKHGERVAAVWSLVGRRRGGRLEAPSEVVERRILAVLEGPDGARAEEVAQAVAAESWGYGAWSRCWTDDEPVALIPSELPRSIRPAGAVKVDQKRAAALGWTAARNEPAVREWTREDEIASQERRLERLREADDGRAEVREAIEDAEAELAALRAGGDVRPSAAMEA